MQTIIDSYMNNYTSFPKGKFSFDCQIGTLTFIRDNSDDIIIFEIFIKLEDRRKGHCKNLILYLISECKKNNTTLRIVSVISKHLYNFLITFRCKEGKFKLDKMGFRFISFQN